MSGSIDPHTHEVLVGNVGQEVILSYGIATIWSLGSKAAGDVERLLGLAFERMEPREVDKRLDGSDRHGPGQERVSYGFEPITLRIEEGAFAGTTWELTCVTPATSWFSWEGNYPEGTESGANDGCAVFQCREFKFALALSFHYGKDEDHRWWSQVESIDHHLEYTLDRAKALSCSPGFHVWRGRTTPARRSSENAHVNGRSPSASGSCSCSMAALRPSA